MEQKISIETADAPCTPVDPTWLTVVASVEKPLVATFVGFIPGVFMVSTSLLS
jgi:hypothetical protein